MFTPIFVTLQQEGYLTRSCICTALTELRNANIGDTGRYYTGFFQLAIAVERLGKLALILQHMADNGLAPPGKAAVKAYKHDLLAVYEAAALVATSRSYPSAAYFQLAPIPSAILSFLSEFAEGARYANLDGLASALSAHDPLASWHQILHRILDADLAPSVHARIMLESETLARATEGMIIARVHDLTGAPLSLAAWFRQPRLYAQAARYASWHIVLLVSPLVRLVADISDAARAIDLNNPGLGANIPYMSEFYQFMPTRRSDVLRKKRWP